MATDLPPRQQRFVEEYLVDLNGTQAAIRAGYSPRSAEVEGSRLLSSAKVAEAVARAKAERSARIGLTADRVLEELAAVAFARMPEFAEWGRGADMRLKPSDELTDHQAAAIVQISETEKYIKTVGEGEQLMSRERTVKLHDKLNALEKLGKHLGIVVDRKEITGAAGSPVQIEVQARDYREALTAFLPPADDDGQH